MALNPEGFAEEGATSVEYALIAALIAVAIVAAVAALGGATAGSIGGFNSQFEQCTSGSGC